MDVVKGEKNDRFFLRNDIVHVIDKICDISRRHFFNIKESASSLNPERKSIYLLAKIFISFGFEIFSQFHHHNLRH